jgi:hypothetical protein
VEGYKTKIVCPRDLGLYGETFNVYEVIRKQEKHVISKFCGRDSIKRINRWQEIWGLE